MKISSNIIGYITLVSLSSTIMAYGVPPPPPADPYKPQVHPPPASPPNHGYHSGGHGSGKHSHGSKKHSHGSKKHSGGGEGHGGYNAGGSYAY